MEPSSALEDGGSKIEVSAEAQAVEMESSDALKDGGSKVEVSAAAQAVEMESSGALKDGGSKVEAPVEVQIVEMEPSDALKDGGSKVEAPVEVQIVEMEPSDALEDGGSKAVVPVEVQNVEMESVEMETPKVTPRTENSPAISLELSNKTEKLDDADMIVEESLPQEVENSMHETKIPEATDISATVTIVDKENRSLSLLRTYSISSSDGDGECSEEQILNAGPNDYRNTKNETVEVTSDSESDSSSDSDIATIEQPLAAQLRDFCADDEDEDADESGKPRRHMKVKGELGLEDLPPIEDLQISVPQQECIEMGKVMSIIDQLVMVQSKPDMAALDIDTLLFLDSGARPLGKVFDVIGQVASPFYCVRFNSKTQIAEKNIEVGLPVYCAPNTNHTSFIVVANLMKMKGSDASWDHDIEPPEGCLDYSDDEEERELRRARKAARNPPVDDPNKRMRTFSGGGRGRGQHNGRGSGPRSQMNRHHPPQRPHMGTAQNPFHHWQSPYRASGSPFLLNPYSQVSQPPPQFTGPAGTTIFPDFSKPPPPPPSSS